MSHNKSFLVAGAARELSAAFPAWLCDVWGVVHDGRQVYPAAAEALTRHRERGGCVVLITNAPRPHHVIVPQMRSFGVPDSAYDAVVSSGDVTRELVRRRAGSNCFIWVRAKTPACCRDCLSTGHRWIKPMQSCARD